MKLLKPLLGSLLLFLFLLAGCDTSTESDTTAPNISFRDLSDNMIVEAPFLCSMTVSDNQGVARVLFEVDGVLIDSLTRYSAPFSPTIYWGERRLGETMELRVIAYDDAGNSRSTGPIVLYRQWREVATDGDDEFDSNLYRLLSRCDGTHLDFRVETYGTWSDPYSSDGGVNCGLFLDTDQDATTGLSAESGYHYAPGDIGAEFGAFIGLEGDSLFAWDGGDTAWVNPSDFRGLYLPENANAFEVSILLDRINDPAEIDLVVGWQTVISGSYFADWLPDNQSVALPIVANYLPLISTPQKSGRVSTQPKRSEVQNRYWRR